MVEQAHFCYAGGEEDRKVKAITRHRQDRNQYWNYYYHRPEHLRTMLILVA